MTQPERAALLSTCPCCNEPMAHPTSHAELTRRMRIAELLEREAADNNLYPTITNQPNEG